MATWDDVRVRALALPETDEIDRRGSMTWRVKEKGFVWERPLNKADVKRQEAAGLPIPAGPIFAARVDDEGVKAALIAGDPEVYFTISHFDGYSAVLVLLDKISPDELDELIVDAWLSCAPAKLAKTFFG